MTLHDDMEKSIKNNLLLDFYGAMLTEKQQEVMELYLEQDVSLSEIASLLNLSRQAVYDIVKNAQNTLQFYENKLCLVESYIENKNLLTDCLNRLKTMQGQDVKHIASNIEKVIDNL